MKLKGYELNSLEIHDMFFPQLKRIHNEITNSVYFLGRRCG